MNDYLLDHANDTIARRHAEADRHRLARAGRTGTSPAELAGSRRQAARGPLGLVLSRVPLF